MSSFGGDSEGHLNYFSYPMYKDIRDQNQVFSGVLAADKAQVGLSWHNQAENNDAEIVSGNYFQLLGLKPAVGRLFTPEDDTAKDANPVTVLSYNYWRTHFGSARDVIGQTILINGHSFTIIGVAPPNFDSAIGGYRPSVFVPTSMIEYRHSLARASRRSQQSSFDLAHARRAPQARSYTSSRPKQACVRCGIPCVRKNLPRRNRRSERFRKNFLDCQTFKVLDDSKGFNPNRIDLQKPLVILMSMAGLLVVLCAINVATLLLLRAADRAREMSMRYALGARRSRIFSQLMIEGGVLGLTGAIAGILLAPAVSTALVRVLTNSDPGTEPYSASVDMRVLLFTLADLRSCDTVFQHRACLSFHSAQSRWNHAAKLRDSLSRFTALPQTSRRSADCTQRPAARRRWTLPAHARQSSSPVGGL